MRHSIALILSLLALILPPTASAFEKPTFDELGQRLSQLPGTMDVREAVRYLGGMSYDDVRNALVSIPEERREILVAEAKRLATKAMTDRVSVNQLLLSSQVGNKTASVGMVIGVASAAVFILLVQSLIVCEAKARIECKAIRGECHQATFKMCQAAVVPGFDGASSTAPAAPEAAR